MKSFTDLFVTRPVLAIVVNLVIIIAGLQAIFTLNVRQYPRSDNASVKVTTVYVGAGADLVRGFITTPLERVIASADGIEYLESQSAQGLSTITARLKLNQDPTKALAEISSKVDQVRGDLPPEAEVPVLNIESADSEFASAYLSFASDVLEQNEITDYLVRAVQPRLSALEGVQRADILGNRTFAMRIWLKPDRMAALNISPVQVRTALAANNYLAAPGRTKGALIKVDLTANTDLRSVDEFRNLVIREKGGALVRLSDIADVALGAEDYDSEVRFSGQTAVFMGIFPLPNANAIDVIKRVRAEMAEIQRELPTGLQAQIAYDATNYINNAIKEVVKTLGDTLIIVVIIIFLFLGSIRSVLVPVVAIPISLIGGIFLMQVFGFTINLLTLLAIVLSVGLVVDDAIVVVENVERVMSEEGLSPKEATRKSMAEITPALVGIALTLSAVFIPMAFFGGSTGVIYRQFSITIVSAMVLSVLVALTLTPALCATLLKPIAKGQHSPHGAPRKGIAGWIDRFFVGFNRRFDRSADSYQRGVGTVVRRGKRMMLVYVLICAGMAVLFLRLPTSFLPNEDQGAISVQITLPPGSSNARLQAVMAQVQKYFAAQPDVISFNSITGSGGDQSSARGFVRLTNWSQRTRPDQSADAIARKATKDLAAIRDARIFVLLPPAVRGLGANAGFNFQLKDLNGLGHDALVAARDKVLELAAKRPELSNTRSTNLDDTAQLGVDIDDSKAGALGLATVDVNNTLSSALGGTYVNDFLNKGRVKRVYMQGDAPFRMLPQDVGPWTVRNNQGQMVPFSAFSSTRWTYGSPQLQRYNGSPSYEFVGSAAAGVSSGVAMAAVEDIMKEMPAGIGYEWTGASFQERLSGSQAPLLYAVSILFVFLCLAALYESWSVPFSVILVVPLGIVGALLGIGFRGLSNDVYFQVGLLTTVGLSSKNAILIVEFATQLQERGRSVLDATLEAVRLRLRPILMTSLAFGFGVLPLALGSGAGAGGRQAIGTAVLGGMVSATVLGIFFVPVFFVLIRGYFAERKAKQTASETGAAA